MFRELLFVFRACANAKDSVSYRSGPPTPNATKSFWLENAPLQDIHTTAELPSYANVLIIGAGITGASVAYHLTKVYKQKNIVMLDARGVAGGATGRNGGILSTLESNKFKLILNEHSPTTAINLNKWTISNVQFVQSFLKENKIDADLVINGSFDFYSDAKETEHFSESIKLMQSFKQGMEFELILSPEVNEITGSPTVAGATVVSKELANNPNFGYLWAAKLVFGMVNIALETGDLNLQTQTLVTSVTENTDDDKCTYPWIVHCNGTENNEGNNGLIKSKKVVYATNGYTSYLLPEYSSLIVPVKEQMIATQPLDYVAWHPSFFCCTNEDYEYYHQRLSDMRIIIGGGLTVIDDDSWIGDSNDSYVDEKVSKYLQTFLNVYHPIIADNGGVDIYMAWTGIQGYSVDSLPWIGPLVDKRDMYICAGYTGEGLRNALNAGKAVAMMIVGLPPEPFVKQFLPSSRQSGVDM